MSHRDRVRAYLADHPDARNPEVAAALSLTVDQAKDARRSIPRAPASETRLRLPCFMAPGSGDREDDCASDTDCLTEAAHSMPGGAHCPEACERFQRRDPEQDVIAGMVPRESWGGAAW